MHRKGAMAYWRWRQALNDGAVAWVRWWRVGNVLRPEISISQPQQGKGVR